MAKKQETRVANMAGLYGEEQLGEGTQPSLWAGEFRVAQGGNASQDISITGTGRC